MTVAGQETTRTAPGPMRWAAALMLIGAAASLTQAVLTVVFWDRIATVTLARSLTPNTVTGPFMASLGAWVATWYGLVTGVLGVGMWLWMAWANLRGRRWARAVATVLGCLAVLSVVMTFVATWLALVRIPAAVVTVAGVAAVVLLYHRDSSRFIAAGGRT